MRPMKKLPIAAIGLSMVTLVSSLVVAYLATGSFLGSVTMVQLKSYGGVNLSDLADWQLWKLFTAQLVHSKQYHMFYNLLALLALGYAMEKYIGSLKFLLIWFVTGALGTIYSTLFVQAPWNTGTGGSQAILGLAGFGVVLTALKTKDPALLYALVFSLIPAFSLDLIFAHYPKPGHVLSLVLGMLLGVVYLNRLKSTAM